MLKKNIKIIVAILSAGLLTLLALNIFFPKEISQIAITTIRGDTIKIYESKNKFTLINFWATDCPGCIKEMPQLVESYNMYHISGFQIVGVAMSYDPPNHVLEFVKKNNIPFPITLDLDQKIARHFGDIRLTPTSIILDQNGVIIDQIIGEINFDKLNDLLKKNL